MRIFGCLLCLGWCLAAAPGVFADQAAAPPAPGPVFQLHVEGIIDPITAQYIERGLRRARQASAPLVIIRLDTPGGLDRSMRRCVQAILTSAVPVVVHVAPSGARAASAGAFIGLAAHVLAMAPGTNIGAAHPVDALGKSASQKIANDAAAYLESLAKLRGKSEAWARAAVTESASTPATAAKAAGVADLISGSAVEILAQLEGRTFSLGDRPLTLSLQGVPLQDLPMNLPERFLHALADPNITYVLFLIGIYGILYELAAPSLILPGVAGAISLLLALMGFEGLPVSVTGLLFMALGAVLLILEVFIVSHGILGIGGLLALILGSAALFPSDMPAFRAATGVMVSMLASTAIYLAFIVYVLVRGRKSKRISGTESLPGATGLVKERLAGHWLVHVQGDDWQAVSTDSLQPGDAVEVLAVEGLTLKVKKKSAGPETPR